MSYCLLPNTDYLPSSNRDKSRRQLERAKGESWVRIRWWLGLVYLDAGFVRFGSSTKHSEDTREESVKNVADDYRQQNIARVEENEHADGNGEDYRAHAATPRSHCFEA